MTLNPSGPMSLGGSSPGASIAVELGLSATARISLNDTAVRSLLGVGSGRISMSDAYSKSGGINVDFTTSTADAYIDVFELPGYQFNKSIINITVNSGVYLWASNTGSCGLRIVNGRPGDTIELINNGLIIGCGGNGGSSCQIGGYIANPTAGGAALNTSVKIYITNNGYIAGGGGGGCEDIWQAGGGGAGGGAGGSYLCSNGYGSPNYYGGGGAGIGGVGGEGQWADYGQSGWSAGGGGGRILPGNGGYTPYNQVNPGSIGPSRGGGSGGSGGWIFGCNAVSPGAGGSGNSPGQAGPHTAEWEHYSGGGGGWGASGGASGGDSYEQAGAPGGPSLVLNGNGLVFRRQGECWGAIV